MTAAAACLALAAAVLGLGWGLLYVGSRAGDRPGDAALGDIGPDGNGAGISFTVTNRGPHAVLIGASLRRRSIRLRCEYGHFVTVPARTWRTKLLAGRHAVVSAVDAGETQAVLVPVSGDTPRRAALVVAVGERDRLWVLHRAVSCDGLGPSAPPEPTPLQLTQPS